MTRKPFGRMLIWIHKASAMHMLEFGENIRAVSHFMAESDRHYAMRLVNLVCRARK